MSSKELHTNRHRHVYSPGHEARKKHRSDSKKGRERSVSPRHTTSHKRLRRSPSPSKHKSSNRNREKQSPSSDSVTNDVTHHLSDSNTVTDRTLLLRQKLDERKLKRQRNQSPTQSADALDVNEVRNWVERSRQLEFDKKYQEDKPTKDKKDNKYRSSDLKGMKIGHDVGGFLEGEENILTLKDRDILDEETEETLQNPTMIDIDRASKNRETKGLRTGIYDPLADSETALEGIESALRGERQVGNVLAKYDDEISGEKTQSFYLSDNGQLDTDSSVLQESKKRESILSQLGKREVDLNFEHKYASQVMTSEEIAEKFRRIKKRRKVVPLRAEDLLQQSSPLLPPTDLGSRDRAPETSSPPPSVTTFQSRKINSDDVIGPSEATMDTPLSIIPSADEEDNLANAIDRIRKLRETAFSNRGMDPIDRAAAIARQTTRIKSADISTADVKPSAMIFDSTQEFVRSLNTQSSLSRNRLHDNLSEMRTDNHEAMELGSEGEEERDGWKELKNGSDFKPHIKSEDREDYFEAEPIVSHSITSTLLLAERKGFIEQSRTKGGYTETVEESKHKNDISARNYSLLDKQTRGGDQRERTRDSRDDYRDRDRDSFPEKKDYIPEIKLEYVDDLGRELSQKEAFRRMSHIFHGKGSGKLKAERRLKKSEDELSMMKMNSFDTPLNTVAMATRKMETSGIPYLILSGGQHSLETGSVTEPSTLTKRRK
ncbi:U4/U6.U5 tri-snRNP-associated protein 1 [Oopsacas minuta]|uniref:U4/U6.U5 tri-snRNP-associated protein 1 n=1 Tax=Oopsacas minuta TaxID=111878 RepID=A0AAV7JT31_9METZ|nr:U4/U6.U5 tri-snRNP-associated protein 1 [Oopsacas minuta]